MSTFPNEKKYKWLVVVNPAASGGKVGQRWNEIHQKLISENIDFIFEPVFRKTHHKGHAIEIVKTAIQNGFRKIIAVGGDGTGNEVANGILQQKIVEPSNIIFAMLPVGTGNDWIKTHRIPKNLTAWIHCLKNEKTMLQDVGKIECELEGQKITRYFINVAGMAYDAFVVQKSEGKPTYLFPKIQYLLLTFKCLFQYRLKRAKLIFDDQIVEDYFYTINAGICKYSGGGMQLVPHANPTDGHLALTYAGKLSKLEIILNSWRFYTNQLLEYSKVHGFLTKEIRVETLDNDPTGIEVDGEFIGHTPLKISVLRKGLKVVVP